MAKESIGEVILKDVRLSFPSLFERQSKEMVNEDGTKAEPKYKANFLIPKDARGEAIVKMLRAAAAQVKEAQWPGKDIKLKPEKVFLRDGDHENWDGYASNYYVSANNANQPVLVDNRKDAKGKWVELTKENGGPKKLYAGARVNAVVRIWAQDNKHGKRLNASVESVQFWKHDEPFSGAAPVDPNEKFADIAEDEGESIGSDDLVDSLI